MNHAWDDGIEISAIGSLADLAEWQAVEALVWSGAGSEILHTGLLITLQRYGGLLLSARDRSGKMVGVLLITFSIIFPLFLIKRCLQLLRSIIGTPSPLPCQPQI